MRSFFKISTLAFAVLCLCVPGLFACNDASTAGTAGCAGGMLTDFNTDGESNLFDGPVDLPVSIAKNIDGVDASTMTFQSSGGAFLTRALSAHATSSTTVGTIFFQLHSR